MRASRGGGRGLVDAFQVLLGGSKGEINGLGVSKVKVNGFGGQSGGGKWYLKLTPTHIRNWKNIYGLFDWQP